ncbi:MAG TPA: MBL fold metallo-hydrolase [Flavobacteriales bacterium]|nr:MBL fold metallo-hydrolase [Flavobacteriales bacterium]
MKIEQIYTGCLAQGAYFIESNGEAVVIDPLREVEPYLERAEKSGVKIKYVLETHFHADFVSGHIDLAAKSGAQIVYGPTAKPGFEAYVAVDDEVLSFGNVKMKVLHTPGHTMESSCFLLIDEHGNDVALFSGDTLFIGDVGRPDLAQKAAHMTQEQLAETLFDSLRNKIMPLNDEIVVYPAHGAGSACGKNMSKETTDLLGNQKKNNYALRADMTKAEFVKEVTTGLMPPPAYFPLNVAMNKNGYDSIDTVLERGTRALSPAAFEAVANETNAIILDTRDAQTFAKAFIPNSINIGIDGGFAPWVGALIPDIKQNILLVTEPGREEEVITRLARVGYDFTIGFINSGIQSWINDGRECDSIKSVSVEEMSNELASGNYEVLDVRKQSEYLSEHMLQAENAPLDYINESMMKIDKSKKYFVHCAAGYRSMIFTSILKARGYDNLIDVKGGFKAIKESGKVEISEYVCPTTLL